MSMKLCGFEVGLEHPFFLIAGPCVVESEQLQMDAAGELKEMCEARGIPFIFKSSFDKANRSSNAGFRGLGMGKGLEILAKVRRALGVPPFGRNDCFLCTVDVELRRVAATFQVGEFLAQGAGCRDEDRADGVGAGPE